MEVRGIHIAFEKVVLLIVILCIWISVLIMEKFMPHQSAAILILCLIMLYGVLISLANYHHRRRIRKGKASVPSDTDYQPTVSLIIPAHNEALVIAETVKNLLEIEYDHYELWVFDDRSTDGTAAVLAGLEKQYPARFHFVVRPESAMPGKSAVLNEALEMTTSDILVVFDADGRVKPDFLKRVLPYLADNGVGAVQARKVIMNCEANLLTRCQFHEYLLDAHFQAGRDVIRGAVELRGNGQFAKRIALQSVGGWTEDTITDDLDLSTKLHLAGWDIRWANDVTVEEEGILHFKPLLRQRRRWAEGSLKRYLEHSINVLTSPHVSQRAQLDMFAYFLEFLFPLWVATDCFLQVVNLIWGEWPRHLISSFIMLPALFIFFGSGLFVAIRQYERASIFHSLMWAVETSLFLLIVWVPVVMWITAKVLVSRDDGPLNWGKTEHLGTPVMTHPSRMARIKNFLQGSGHTH